MKWSQFNFLFHSEKIGYCLHNTRMLSLMNLDKVSYETLCLVEKHPDKAETLLDENTYKYFVKNKILVKEYEDKDYINKLAYTKRYACSEESKLGIVLCPTLGCNFACPYCYEDKLSSKPMSIETQMKVIDFINQYKDKKKGFTLNWHGGEPLSSFKVIKQFYSLIEKYSELPLLHSSMVSNGYLLTQEICEYFESKKLNYLQITIDGNKITHNKTRILKNGKGTFDRIIHNIDLAVEYMPNCTIGVRTNIGIHNKDEYSEIYKIFSERWKGKNVNVYYAFILNNSLEEKKDNSSVELSTREKCNFLLSLAKGGVISSSNLYPKVDCNSCTCTDMSAYVIDPNGYIYKCWADVGIKKRAVGNLDEGLKNFDIISEFVQGSDKFSDPKCNNCRYMPICDGGCNLYRVKSKRNGIPYEVCQYDDQGMQAFLEEFTLNNTRL